jgi:hypothetical protein
MQRVARDTWTREGQRDDGGDDDVGCCLHGIVAWYAGHVYEQCRRQSDVQLPA